MLRPKSARVDPVGETIADWKEAPTTPPGTSPPITPPGTSTSVEIFPSGKLIGQRYEIVRLVGRGGMGAVYEAKDLELERTVAIKVIREELASDPEVLRRFKQELITARQVSHRNVVRIFDLGEADGTKFITMEFVEGVDLCTLLNERGAFSSNEAVDVMRQVCAGVEAAHAEGVIHRDLKPANIMLSESGRVYVMDFGIARSAESAGMTQTGSVLGTLEYMAPEQAKGEATDQRSDLYALGLIFYETLTGQRAFKGETALGSLYRRTRERPLPPAQVNPSVPATLSAIVTKCLEPDKSKRYQSAAEIMQDLDVSLGRHPRTDFRHSRILIPHATNRWPLLASAVLATILIALGGVYLWRSRTPVTNTHSPVSVLVADFTNHTGDPIFDGTLEPMFNVALEGASFVNAYNRGEARKTLKGIRPDAAKLDEEAARLVALNQNIGAVISGSISRRGDGYKVSVEALDGASGNTIASSEISASSKDDLLLAIPKLAAPVRKALGDSTPESVQLAATAGGFSAASLEAVHQYGAAMEQQFAGDFEGALKSFSKAAELDPGFARAYSGMAISSRNLGHPEDAEKYFKSAMEHVDRMTERERLRTRGAYYVTIGNLPKCVEEYSALVSKYPSDNMGHNNLATCYSRLRNYPKAVEELKRAVELSPRAALQRANLSLNATYSGDFETGEREAREVQKLNPAYEQAYQTLADAQMGQGHVANAEETYRSLAKLNDAGASLAASGLADVAIYQGRFKDAAQLLEKAAAVDLAKEGPEQAADKFTAISYARLSSGDVNGARKAAMRALEISKTVKIRFLAAQVLARAGDLKTAGEVARTLAAESLLEPKVYAQLIDAEIALQSKDARKAIEIISQANKNLDTWIGRLNLARAYIEAGMFTEADSELDACIRRRGEAVEMMDDGPTFGYFPEVYYLQGRVRQGLKSAGFAESYRAYLDIRGAAGEDPLLGRIRSELAAATQ